MIYFISGHGDLKKEEFNNNYLPKLDKALEDKNTIFIIGDFRGADKMSFDYLKKKTKNIKIYHMFLKPRYDPEGFNTIGGFDSDNERDIAMTVNSNIDIAWIRPGREKSGTAKNLMRRKEFNQTI